MRLCRILVMSAIRNPSEVLQDDKCYRSSPEIKRVERVGEQRRDVDGDRLRNQEDERNSDEGGDQIEAFLADVNATMLPNTLR